MPARLPARFTDAEAARKYLEGLLWQDGPVCAHCQDRGQSAPLKGKSTRPGVYWCNACRKPFSVTVGTVYENSKIPLNIWLYANHQLCSARKAISGLALARLLGVSYKTAWFMAHHIREAMVKPAGSDPPKENEEVIASTNDRQDGPWWR
jgi:transposase-like protein